MTTLSHPGDALSRRQRTVYILILGALTALGPFTIDLYLPAFPRIAEELHTSDAAVQLTLTATTIGFGIGQLIIGPWSDTIGRRIPLLVASSLHVIASLGVILAPSVELVAVMRVGQGVGAAAGSVVALAMVRDLFGGKPLVRMLSRLALVNGLAPVLAPLIGSQLLRVMDWRGVFVFLAGYGVFVLVATAVFLVETLPAEARRTTGRVSVLDRFRALFRDRVFLGAALIGGMVFSSILSYVSSSPFLLQDLYGIDPQQFGLLFGLNSFGLLVAVQVSARLVPRIGAAWVLAIGTSSIALSGAALVVAAHLGNGPLTVIVPFFFLVSSCGLCFPCIQVLTLANHGTEAGTAASLTGAANAAIAGLVSTIPGFIGLTSGAPVGWVVLAAMTVATASLWLLVRPWSVPPLAD
ncbi:MAG: multidrug effflux MFS transporter [Pseudolysinimonas sp.]|uniref:multidrug effflux MFS transporter n=1 Tax=Pseudolysinimonas sp. TaxID=2680009 RepID=UPI003267A195